MDTDLGRAASVDVLPDFEPHRAFYRRLLEAHGPSTQSVSWRTKESQDLRFEKLLSVVDLDTSEPIIVNDLGCAYGPFFGFLDERRVAVQQYYGYDICPEMLAALSSLESSRVEAIHSCRVTNDADYSFASGVFNLRFDVADDQWRTYVRSLVLGLAEHSRRGFAFNLLSTYNDYQQDHLFYGDPCEWFDWCKRDITSRVTLLHDYPLYEWTIVGFLS